MNLSANVLWDRSDPRFGGFSGLEITDQGRQMTVITDRGRLLTVGMIRDGAKLQSLQLQTDHVLANANGVDLRRFVIPAEGDEPRRIFIDSEGLAIGREGQAFVSFESKHRVARVSLDTGRTQDLGGHPDFDLLQLNGGLEALAIHPDGTLFTLPERSGRRDGAFPLYTWREGVWKTAGSLPRRGSFLPVGADFDDQGRLYLLERTVTPLGFRSRIRRFDLTAPSLGEVTLLTSLPGRFDNLEAISVWKDMQGQTFLTMISDDNFLRIQRTQIVEYALTE